MVVEQGGFEKAAQRLFITQSAVSQRIRSLEEQIGKIVITRANPPIPTVAGYELIKHCHQVGRLEAELENTFDEQDEETFSTLSIGTNADSLALWLLPSLQDFYSEHKIVIDFSVDDQDETRTLLQNGIVAGCITSNDKPLKGCSMTHLGKMDYHLVCTPAFKERWFKKGLTIESIQEAPAVIFNSRDTLQRQYLLDHYQMNFSAIPTHQIPSTEKFLELISMGSAYGMVPFLQYRQKLKTHELVELSEVPKGVDLFWHCWNIPSRQLSLFSEAVISGAKEYLH